MYNLLISLAIGATVFGVVAWFFTAVAAAAPALFVFGLSWFLLARRTGAQLQAAIAPLQALLSAPVSSPAEQSARLREAEGLLRQAQATYGPWQFLVSDQLDNQIGMLRYMAKQFDEALPLLEKGWWRDWMSQAAVGCIYARRKDWEAAFAAFEGATSTTAKEPMIYILWGGIAARSGQREQALHALTKGLEAIEGQPTLRALKAKVANKESIDDADLPDAWFTQFFPDELERLMRMRGGRGVHPVVQRLMAAQGVDPSRMAPQMARPQGKGAGKRSRRR